MKKLLLICVLCITTQVYALSGQEYMHRFNTYSNWINNLPTEITPEFINFIEANSPLSNKLREKWLYEIAKTHNWQLFIQYYQPSNDVTLACDAEIAHFRLGEIDKAVATAKLLWLEGNSQPPACNQLFEMLLTNDNFDERLINERIALALDKRNISLVQYLLKQYKSPRLTDIKTLQSINQHPTNIRLLPPGEFQADFYLYGLKRLVSTNMNQAIELWEVANRKKILNKKQQQSFLSHISLYKAMRNNDDAPLWFAKIEPTYYTDLLLEWQIRFELKQQHWQKVEQLIRFSPNQASPCWQYWLARAKAAQGQIQAANAIYESLTNIRNYYGFLASLQLSRAPSFQNENPTTNPGILAPYKSFIDTVADLYNDNQTTQASRLLNDFISELPKKDASALVNWLSQDLQWHGKSVYLSNTDILNNQLALRFPLPYQETIVNFAKNYTLPEAYVYAIIRQESGFREDVISTAGARGLMQLMPATANMVAKREKIKLTDQKQLFISKKNINLGVAYLSQLAKNFGKHPVLMAAAYNAGPHQLQYWLKNHPPKQMDIWIETLPWQETRNYLKNVVAFYVVYQYRMQQKPNLKKIMQSI